MMSKVVSTIRNNYREVQCAVDSACARAQRNPESVGIVAVTKYAQDDWVEALLACEIRDLGESRPQQLAQRAAALPSDCRWHLIGHLQRNKVRSILPFAHRIHSIDSTRLIRRVGQIAEQENLVANVLIEVNVSGEASKDGFAIDQLVAEWDDVIGCQHVNVRGLMTMAPRGETPEAARPYFRRLRELRDTLRDRSDEAHSLPELSMGMSGDFTVAVEEGATLIRVGSRLFTGLTE